MMFQKIVIGNPPTKGLINVLVYNENKLQNNIKKFHFVLTQSSESSKLRDEMLVRIPKASIERMKIL